MGNLILGTALEKKKIFKHLHSFFFFWKTCGKIQKVLYILDDYSEHSRILMPLKKVGLLMQILASLERYYSD